MNPILSRPLRLRVGRIPPAWAIAGGASLLSCLLLLLLVPLLAGRIPDAGRLAHRAVTNFRDLAVMQVTTFVGVNLLAVLLRRIPRTAAHLAPKDWRQTFRTLLQAALPLLLLLILHQTVPLWQRVTGWPDADPVLIRLDEWLFGGVNPSLWLERWIHPLLTEYMWAVYLAWFIAFQGTIYLLALLRPAREWQDMVLGTVITLTLGYIGYVLVPAVGPVHAMRDLFTIDLQGGPVARVTTGIVDQFGVWRDAFPSLHVAVTMLLMLYSWRYLRRWAVPYTILGVSILFSTVYLRWHYVVDVAAGMLLAGFGAWLAPRLLARWTWPDPLAEDAEGSAHQAS